MRYDLKTAAVLLVLSTILLLSTSLYITSTTISDMDPSTYVIVPMLMLPIFLIFSLKGRPEPAVGKRDVPLGLALLLLFILTSIALRLHFTAYFVGFRIDMLLMPLGLAGLTTLFFGIRNITSFRGAIIYSLLASPVVLLPLLLQYGAFTQANSLLVYSLLRPFIPALQYTAPGIIGTSGNSISIGQACVSLGIFIALALFLIPVAYFYEGRNGKKALWVASGAALLFLLNLTRMFAISLVWLAYGPNGTALLIHTFIGVLLFYIVIIAMMLLSKRFGLSVKPRKTGKRKVAHAVSAFPYLAGVFLCLLYATLTLNYASALTISPLSLANKSAFNFSNAEIASQVQAIMNRGGFISFAISSGNGSTVLYYLSNASIPTANPLLIYFTPPSSNSIAGLQQHNTLQADMQFFNRKGAAEHVYLVLSNSTEYVVYNTNYPFQLSKGSTATAGVLLIAQASQLPSNYACGSYDPVYSSMLNILKLASYNQSATRTMLAAECMSDRLIWG